MLRRGRWPLAIVFLALLAAAASQPGSAARAVEDGG